MCLQDLQIARRKYVQFNTATAPATALTIPADPRRVAVIFGAGVSTTGGHSDLFAGPSAAAGVRIAYTVVNGGSQVLTIEQVGQLITGQLTIDNMTAGTTGFIHSVYINESDDQLVRNGR